MYEADACFLRALILRRTDSLADDVAARLALLRAKYRAALDGGMLDLIARACDVHAEAVGRVEVDTDRAYLHGLIDGTEDPLSEDTFPKLEPMFTRYAEGTEMFALLERAAEVFGEAVQEVVAWAMAGLAIDDARRGHPED